MAIVGISIDGGTVVGTAAPLPVTAQSPENVFSPTITSAGVYSSGMCLGAPVTIANGGDVRHLSVDLNATASATISAMFLRSAPTTASTLKDHSAASIAAADAGTVINNGGAIVLSAVALPGGNATNWFANNVDVVVASGAQIVLIAGGTISAGATTSGLTIGAGIV